LKKNFNMVSSSVSCVGGCNLWAEWSNVGGDSGA
jgi:hypothetical protein